MAQGRAADVRERECTSTSCPAAIVHVALTMPDTSPELFEASMSGIGLGYFVESITPRHRQDVWRADPASGAPHELTHSLGVLHVPYCNATTLPASCVERFPYESYFPLVEAYRLVGNCSSHFDRTSCPRRGCLWVKMPLPGVWGVFWRVRSALCWVLSCCRRAWKSGSGMEVSSEW